jgi:hypothetical protein
LPRLAPKINLNKIVVYLFPVPKWVSNRKASISVQDENGPNSFFKYIYPVSNVNNGIAPLPSLPEINIENDPCSGKAIMTHEESNGSFWSYYWLSALHGFSTENGMQSMEVNTSGTYYLRARHSSGGWSSNYLEIEIEVDKPYYVSAPSKNQNCDANGTILIRREEDNPDWTYYWQTSADGEDKSDATKVKNGSIVNLGIECNS